MPVAAAVLFCPYSQSGRIAAGWPAQLTMSWSWDVFRKQSFPGFLVLYIGLSDRNFLAFPLAETSFLKTLGGNLAAFCIPA